MDRDFNIYSAPGDLIPDADKARLGGYLKGREEAAHLAEAAFEVKFAEMEAQRERVQRIVDESQA
jgi:hypothetical protein